MNLRNSLALGALCAFACGLNAQTTNSSIVGSVTDTSAATVPGATLRLTDTATRV